MLKLNKARLEGLDKVKEWYIWDTFEVLIAELSKDMKEQSNLLNKVKNDFKHTIQVWQNLNIKSIQFSNKKSDEVNKKYIYLFTK